MSEKLVPCEHTVPAYCKQWSSDDCPLCDDDGMRREDAVELFEKIVLEGIREEAEAWRKAFKRATEGMDSRPSHYPPTGRMR